MFSPHQELQTVIARSYATWQANEAYSYVLEVSLSLFPYLRDGNLTFSSTNVKLYCTEIG